jgi:hypothetical protein
MDLTEALVKWSSLPDCTTAGWDSPDGCYYILFIDHTQTVKGYVKTIPGQGFKWEYPDALMKQQDKPGCDYCKSIGKDCYCCAADE